METMAWLKEGFLFDVVRNFSLLLLPRRVDRWESFIKFSVHMRFFQAKQVALGWEAIGFARYLTADATATWIIDATGSAPKVSRCQNIVGIIIPYDADIYR